MGLGACLFLPFIMKKYFLYSIFYLSIILGFTSCLGLNLFSFGIPLLFPNLGSTNNTPQNRQPERQPERQNPNNGNQNTNKNPVNNNPKNTELDLRRLSCRAKIIEQNADSLRVFLEMDIPRIATQDNAQNLNNEISLNYGILENYSAKNYIETPKKLEINPQNVQFDSQKGFYYTDFVIEKRSLLQAVLITKLKDIKTGQELMSDTPIPNVVTKLKEKFYVAKGDYNTPYFTQYLLDKDVFRVKNLQNENRSFFVKYYRNPQEPATPPMSMINRNPQRAPKADSIFSIKTNTKLQFANKGLYIVQSDTADFFGITLYIGEREYPKYTKVQDVIEPLVYITTEMEMQKLKANFNNAQLSKKELDNIWLSLMKGNSKLAQAIIRTYYTRVKLANHFFTTFKEGWKTDMGMVYIVYGTPDKSVRTQDTEHWFYTKDPRYAEIKFSFNRRPNALSDNNYMLARYPEYESIWFPAIEKWREGKIQ